MNEGRREARFAATARSKGGNVNYQLLWIVCPSSNAEVETYFPQCDIIRRLGPLGSDWVMRAEHSGKGLVPL